MNSTVVTISLDAFESKHSADPWQKSYTFRLPLFTFFLLWTLIKPQNQSLLTFQGKFITVYTFRFASISKTNLQTEFRENICNHNCNEQWATNNEDRMVKKFVTNQHIETYTHTQNRRRIHLNYRYKQKKKRQNDMKDCLQTKQINNKETSKMKTVTNQIGKSWNMKTNRKQNRPKRKEEDNFAFSLIYIIFPIFTIHNSHV